MEGRACRGSGKRTDSEGESMERETAWWMLQWRLVASPMVEGVEPAIFDDQAESVEEGLSHPLVVALDPCSAMVLSSMR